MNATIFQQRYGPWAVVAGASAEASSGVGAEYAAQLAARGLNLMLIARRQEQLDALAAQLADTYHIKTRTLALDLTREDVGEIVGQTTNDLDIGLLVYNAGVTPVGGYLDLSLETHLAEVAVNCRAPMVLAYTLGQRMRARGHGGIILMSSLSAAQGSALIANYAATKAFNLTLAEGLWDELRAAGIDVIASMPSAITSAQSQGASATTPPRVVVAETLAALGRRPSVIPGMGNRLAAFVMRRALPRRTAIRLMGRVMRGMYPMKRESQADGQTAGS